MFVLSMLMLWHVCPRVWRTCICVLLCLHQPPADGTKTAMSFVLSLLLSPGLTLYLRWIHIEACDSLPLPPSHAHTYLYIYIYLWEAWKLSLRSSLFMLGPERRIFWVLPHYFWFVPSYNFCFCWRLYLLRNKWHTVTGACQQTHIIGSPLWTGERKSIKII